MGYAAAVAWTWTRGRMTPGARRGCISCQCARRGAAWPLLGTQTSCADVCVDDIPPRDRDSAADRRCFFALCGSSAISLTGFHVQQFISNRKWKTVMRHGQIGEVWASPRAGTRLSRSERLHFDARGDDGLASTSANEVTASHARCVARALASRKNRTGRSLAAPSGSSSSRWRCSPDAHPRLIGARGPRTSRASRGRRAEGSRRRSRRARAPEHDRPDGRVDDSVRGRPRGSSSAGVARGHRARAVTQ